MQRLKPVLIFILAFLAYFQFVPADPVNWQQVTRMALAISLSEGHADIDLYAPATEDKAFFEGHYYADKPPGLSLLAVPLVALVKATGTDDYQAELTVSILGVVSLISALAVALVYLIVRRFGASDRAAVFAACALALGTPFLGWSTTFFVHTATGGMLVIALAIAVFSRGKAGLWQGIVLGLVLGYLLVMDLTAAPAAAMIGLYFLLDGGLRPFPWTRLWTALLGGLLGILPLLIYNDLVFGSPFRLGYAEVVGFDGMKQGVFGLGVPDLGVLVQILFSLHRGLLPLAPVLILVPVGLFRMVRDPSRRDLGITVTGVMVAFLLINASYYYWDGGGSTGPRHVVAMLPMAAIALAFAWPRTRAGQGVALALLAVSLVISVICVSVYMFMDASYANPFYEQILPTFFDQQRYWKALPIVIEWLGFAMLFWWPSRPQGDQLPARPLDAPGEIELQK